MLEKSFQPREAEQVPQLRKSGISSDYINEFAAINMGVSMSKTSPEMASQIMQILREKVTDTGKLIHSYEERFPTDKFSDVITEKNHSSIEQINELAEKCNSLFNNIDNNPNLSEGEKLTQITEKIMPLVTKIQQLIESEDQSQPS